MKFTYAHSNINVTDIERSVAFYSEALGLKEARRKESAGFTLVFLSDGKTPALLELTCLKDHPGAYDLGENESHLAYAAADIDAAHALHEKMGCICYENKTMGVYFIEDPDGYWIEIVRA